MHSFYEVFDPLRAGVGIDAVPKIGDVPLAAEDVQHLLDQFLQFGLLGVQGAGIEIALQSDRGVFLPQGSNLPASDRPVQTDDIERGRT